MLPDRVIRISGAKGPRVEPDLWRFAGFAPGEPLSEPLPPEPVVVPLDYWLAHREALLKRREPLGVWLKPDDDPARLEDDVEALSLIAVFFPKFTDGRGYSTAVLLRTRLGYKAELRAFGDVGRDQLFYLRRCGFDAFGLAAHRDPESALDSLQPFSVRYQASVDEPVPLFRKRVAGATR